MAPGIYGFDRMVVRLEDFDAGLTAYSNLFGEPRDVGTNDQMGLQMAFFDLPNGGSIEVVAPTSPESVLRAALDKSGAGMNLISFQCDNLAGTIAMMKENGVRVIEDDPTHIMVHPKSTHGVLMQLVEKPANASRRNKAGQVPDTSGVTGIVSFKCCVIFVKDTKAAIASYERLGLRLTFEFENKAAGIVQAGFFLKGGGLIELIGPVDADNIDDPFVKIILYCTVLRALEIFLLFTEIPTEKCYKCRVGSKKSESRGVGWLVGAKSGSASQCGHLLYSVFTKAILAYIS